MWIANTDVKRPDRGRQNPTDSNQNRRCETYERRYTTIQPINMNSRFSRKMIACRPYTAAIMTIGMSGKAALPVAATIIK